MNLNLMTFLVGKAVADRLGEERSTQLGLVAGMMPGFQGVLVSALIAQREEEPAKPVTDPKVIEQQNAMLKRLTDALSGGGAPTAAIKS